MDFASILTHGLWAGLFATGLGVMLTAPPQFLPAAFFCGFAGRVARDVGTGAGLNLNWATVIASIVVVLVTVALVRRRQVSPVVLICGVLPLGAAVAMFNLIFALLQISTASDAALSEAAVAASASFGKVFTTSLAIAVGLAAGMTIVRLGRAAEQAPSAA